MNFLKFSSIRGQYKYDVNISGGGFAHRKVTYFRIEPHESRIELTVSREYGLHAWLNGGLLAGDGNERRHLNLLVKGLAGPML